MLFYLVGGAIVLSTPIYLFFLGLQSLTYERYKFQESIVEQNITPYENPLFVIHYEKRSEKFWNNAQNQLIKVFNKNNNKVEIILIPFERKNNTDLTLKDDQYNKDEILEKNAKNRAKIESTISNGNKDLVVVFDVVKFTLTDLMYDHLIQSVLYEITAKDVISGKEVWKARYSGPFQSHNNKRNRIIAKKLAKKIFKQMVKDNVIKNYPKKNEI